jgi:ribose 5-phosphate isomerase B
VTRTYLEVKIYRYPFFERRRLISLASILRPGSLRMEEAEGETGSVREGDHRTAKIVVGADHFGVHLKDAIRDYLREKGYEVDDFGTTGEEPVDYPDIGVAVAEAVSQGRYDRAVLICGTGAGMAIVANKVPGVRAVCIHDPYTAERARASNDAQIVTMGSEIVGIGVAKKLVDIWLASAFQGGRSARKVAKIRQIEEKFHDATKTESS